MVWAEKNVYGPDDVSGPNRVQAFRLQHCWQESLCKVITNLIKVLGWEYGFFLGHRGRRLENESAPWEHHGAMGTRPVSSDEGDDCSVSKKQA